MRNLSDPDRWLNPNYMTINVEITCVEEKLKDYWEKIDGQVRHPNFISADKKQAYFVYP